MMPVPSANVIGRVAATYAQPRQAASFPKEGSSLPRLIALFRRRWPNKTALHLAARTGTSERAAKNFLSRDNGLSGAALEALLRSDVGLDVLTEIMGDAANAPEWWPEFRLAAELSDLARRSEANTRALQELAGRAAG